MSCMKMCNMQVELSMESLWQNQNSNCWWKKLYHKSSLTQDMFSVHLEFEYSNVEISILLGNDLVIYLENDWL